MLDEQITGAPKNRTSYRKEKYATGKKLDSLNCVFWEVLLTHVSINRKNHFYTFAQSHYSQTSENMYFEKYADVQ